MANGERKTDTLRESHEEREKQHKTGGKDYESHKKSEWKKINEQTNEQMNTHMQAQHTHI